MTGASEAIANYRPRSLSAEAAAFARELTSGARPTTSMRAKSLLFAAGRLAAFCEERRIALEEARELSPSLIERFVASGCGEFTLATRRTLRANLRALARAAGPPSATVPALPRDRAKPPYSEPEIAALLALADAQPNPHRRHRLAALICLGAGAGLMGRELKQVTARDVVRRSGGVLVEVRGARPRVVPVRVSFQDRLLAAAAFRADERYLIGGQQPDRRNVTSGLVASVAGGLDLPSLDTGRLRATWLWACAREIGLKALLDAAGISCPQRLGDVLVGAPPASEDELVARLSGRGS